ncbi:hypothetical protein [uncultured Rikenella sp.]|nr:hypothetical protein [uncultured Rikenella sp.]
MGGTYNRSYNWSSATSSIRSVGLDFNVTWINSSYGDYRAYGSQLRCLSE